MRTLGVAPSFVHLLGSSNCLLNVELPFIMRDFGGEVARRIKLRRLVNELTFYVTCTFHCTHCLWIDYGSFQVIVNLFFEPKLSLVFRLPPEIRPTRCHLHLRFQRIIRSGPQFHHIGILLYGCKSRNHVALMVVVQLAIRLLGRVLTI